MANFVLMAHSGFRYIVLLVLFIAIIKYVIGFVGKGKWSNFDGTLGRIVPIVVDIQWALGLILYIMFAMWQSEFAGIKYWHPLMMTLAVAAAHYFFAMAKFAATDRLKYQHALVGSLVTTVLIAIGVYFVVGSWNIFA